MSIQAFYGNWHCFLREKGVYLRYTRLYFLLSLGERKGKRKDEEDIPPLAHASGRILCLFQGLGEKQRTVEPVLRFVNNFLCARKRGTTVLTGHCYLRFTLFFGDESLVMYLYHDELRAGDLTATTGCGTWLLQVVNDGERKKHETER